MNLFVFDSDPKLSAFWLDDRRKNKLILECAQLMSGAIRLLQEERGHVGINEGELYKLSHKNHPVAIWTRSAAENFFWVWRYYNELLNQRGRPHKCREKSGLFVEAFIRLDFPQEAQTPFANCAANSELKLDFRHLPVHDAYKEYAKARWASDKFKPTWNDGDEPEWR